MSLRSQLSLFTLPIVVMLPLVTGACSSDDELPGPDTSSGGQGSGATGNGTGGTFGPGSGGTAAGGSNSGGAAMNSGGTLGGATGGTANDGSGGAAADGSGGEGPGPDGAAWGQVENPSAACEVGEMPSFGSLTANPKLPDPFKKMDGTRITDKSEWLCRRQEIIKQQYAFIWGEKPVPPEGATTGTVSTSSITVSVATDEGSTQFTLSVNMNGATAPAPAIISYGAGAPAPNGVARITFTAVEQSGGSGAKNGPFYDVYGSDHAAGYLTAQAWQISRVLDVLEQDPSVIDPQRVGLTGCSRNGKGAFVGGALDNRVALTIPVESGLGGTVGLRLVETIGGNEWPYHGISYVRWMSEVALGPFAKANNAAGDDTAKLPVDMHEMMALIAPRGLYIVDNPSISNLDPGAAWVTGNVGKMIFEALGVGDHFAYQGAGGDHCMWRNQYQASLDAMVDKFLKGNDAATTGNVATDLANKPDPTAHIDWDVPTLTGSL